jgi:hypothetical protein
VYCLLRLVNEAPGKVFQRNNKLIDRNSSIPPGLPDVPT